MSATYHGEGGAGSPRACVYHIRGGQPLRTNGYRLYKVSFAFQFIGDCSGGKLHPNPLLLPSEARQAMVTDLNP